LILEVHPDPDSALCDGAQTITPAELEAIATRVELIHDAMTVVPIVA
jgi:3-deoxy-7-phosphoheptulonate synthase